MHESDTLFQPSTLNIVGLEADSNSLSHESQQCADSCEPKSSRRQLSVGRCYPFLIGRTGGSGCGGGSAGGCAARGRCRRRIWVRRARSLDLKWLRLSVDLIIALGQTAKIK
jgi:hypothetical protein